MISPDASPCQLERGSSNVGMSSLLCQRGLHKVSSSTIDKRGLVANYAFHFVFRVGQNGDIQLSGQFILEDHCTFDNKGGIYMWLYALKCNPTLQIVTSLM